MHKSKLSVCLIIMASVGFTACSSLKKNETSQKITKNETQNDDSAWADRALSFVVGDGKLIAEFAGRAVSEGVAKESEMLSLVLKLAHDNHIAILKPVKSLNDLTLAFTKEDSKELFEKFGDKTIYAKFTRIYETPAMKEIAASNEKAIQEARNAHLGIYSVDANGKFVITQTDLAYVKNAKQISNKEISESLLKSYKTVKRNTGISYETPYSCVEAAPGREGGYDPIALTNKAKIFEGIANESTVIAADPTIKNKAACLEARGSYIIEQYLEKNLNNTVTSADLALAGFNSVEETVGTLCERCGECPIPTKQLLHDNRMASHQYTMPSCN